MTRLERLTLAITLLVLLAPIALVVQTAATSPVFGGSSPVFGGSSEPPNLIFLYLMIGGPMIVTAVIALTLYCALPRHIGGRYRTLACAALLLFFLGQFVQYALVILFPQATASATHGAIDAYSAWFQNLAMILAASQWVSVLAGVAFLALCAVSLGVLITRRLRRRGARG